MTTAASPSPAVRAEVPNDLAAFWMPFTPNRAFKKRPRLISRSKDMHYFTPEGREILDGSAALWCCNAGHNRAPIVAAIQRQAAELDFTPTFQFAHPLAFQLSSRTRRSRAGRPRSCLLLQLRIGSRRHRAQDRHRLSQRARSRLEAAADRARARLPRRRLRRHFGRRHGQQPQVLRLAHCRRRSSAGDLQSRAPGLHQGRAGVGRASRRRARGHRRPARRVHHCSRHRRADGRLDRRAARRPQAISIACARSATNTASCSSSTK